MATLAHCISLHSLNPQIAVQIENVRKQYITEGHPAQVATERAVGDIMGQAQTQLDEVVSQINDKIASDYPELIKRQTAETVDGEEGLRKKTQPEPVDNEDILPLLHLMKNDIAEGEPGRRTVNPQTMEPIIYKSTYPDWFKDRGLRKKQMLTILDKAIEGKPLTENQQAILDDSIDLAKYQYEDYLYEDAQAEIENVEENDVDDDIFAFFESKIKEKEPRYESTLIDYAEHSTPLFDYIEKVSSRKGKSDDRDTSTDLSKTKVVSHNVGVYETPVKEVKTIKDAATALAPVANNAQENVVMLVVGKDNKPLAVLRNSIGGMDFSQVDMKSLVGHVFSVPGAKSVYFGHNHPGGVESLSAEDNILSHTIAKIFKDSGVDYRGMLALTSDGKAGFSKPDGTSGTVDFAKGKGNKVAVKERVFKSQDLKATKINAPEKLKNFISSLKEKSGIILLDNQLRTQKLIPMTADEMKKLRTGNKDTGMGRIIKNVHSKNAPRIVAFVPKETSAATADTVFKNIQKFANATGMTTIDFLHGQKSLNDAGEFAAGVGRVLKYKGENNAEFFSIWHSQMEKVLTRKLPGKGDPKMIRQMVESWAKKGEFKKDELAWSGLTDWLDEQDGKVTKQQVLDYLKESNLQNVESLVKTMKGIGGQNIDVVFLDDIKVDPSNPETREKLKLHGLTDKQIDSFSTDFSGRVAGTHQIVTTDEGIKSLIKLSLTDANSTTPYHEITHRLWDLAFSDKEQNFLLKKFGSIENVADELGKRVESLGKKKVPSTTDKLLARLWEMIEAIKNFAMAKGFQSETKIARKMSEGAYAEKADMAGKRGKPRYNISDLTKTDRDYLKAIEAGDMEAAQRMVDEAAEKAGYDRKPAYHGSPADNITIFDNNRLGENTGSNALKGHYFADKEKTAKTYLQEEEVPRPVYKAEINKLYDAYRDATGNEKRVLGNKIKALEEDRLKDHPKFYDRVRSGKIYKTALKLDNPFVYDAEGQAWSPRLDREIRNAMRMYGDDADGVIVKNVYDGETGVIDDITVVYDPNQIKSLDPATYDDDGNIIPLSKRFNPEKDDIRYDIPNENKLPLRAKKPVLKRKPQNSLVTTLRDLSKKVAPTHEDLFVPKSARQDLRGYITKAEKIMRRAMGERQHVYETLTHRLKDEKVFFDKQPKLGRAATDYYEVHGTPGMAKALESQGFSKADAERTEAIFGTKDSGGIVTYYDRFLDVVKRFKGKDFKGLSNYLSHIYKNPPEAEKIIANALSKIPMEGSKYFTKHRVIETLAKAEAERGLERATTNPVRNLLAYVNAVQQFEMAQTIFRDLKDSGLIMTPKQFTKAVQNGSLDREFAREWAPLDDKIFKLVIPHLYTTKAGEEKLLGMTDMGSYLAPPGVSSMVNNVTSKGITNPLLKDAGVVNNALNAVQLGLSTFHGNFILALNGVNDMTLAMSSLLRGDLRNAAKYAGKTVTFPITSIFDYRYGKKIKEAYLDKEVYAKSPEPVRKIVDAMLDANARVTMPSKYKVLKDDNIYTIVNNFKDGKYLGGTAKGLGWILQKTTAPIMEKLVPTMKLSAFAKLYQEELLRNPEEDQAKIAAEMWDRTEDRLGQLSYDNLFWDNTFKDAMHLAVRSVGWNLGDIREAGLGAVDTTKLLGKLVAGKASAKDVTQRTLFLIALPFVTAYIGAVMTYLMTGEPPDELADYFNPPTGGLNPDGTATRLSIPTYMRDFLAIKHQGILTTAEHKVSPLLNMLSELISGENYFGEVLFDDDENYLKSGAKFLGQHLQPFSVQGALNIKRKGGKTGDIALAALGFTPAPRYITQTKDEQKIVELFRDRFKGSKSHAMVERSRMLSKIETDWRKTGKWDEKALREAKKKGLITNIKSFKTHRQNTGLERMFRMLSAEDQAALWEDMSREGQKHFGTLLGTRTRTLLRARGTKNIPSKKNNMTGFKTQY